MQQQHKPHLLRGLNARHIRFIALGSAIGTGLFYGSASAIKAAGPAVLLAYLIGGAAVFIVMRALGEMAVRNPVSGSFGSYARQYLGPLAGFITGWTYTFEMVIVALADVTAFGYEYGQLPGCPAGFKADEKLVAAAESCIKALDLNAVRGLIVSGDAFINGSVGLAKIRHNFPQAIAVEMEATAIAHVCHNFKVPFVVVRAISDVADQQSHLSFEDFLAVAARQSTLMVENLVQNLARG